MNMVSYDNNGRVLIITRKLHTIDMEIPEPLCKRKVVITKNPLSIKIEGFDSL